MKEDSVVILGGLQTDSRHKQLYLDCRNIFDVDTKNSNATSSIGIIVPLK